MNKGFRFSNGDKVKDIVTTYDGVITGRADYLNSCNRYGVESCKLKDNKTIELWFDEDRLALVEADFVNIRKDGKEPEGKPGGPVTSSPAVTSNGPN